MFFKYPIRESAPHALWLVAGRVRESISTLWMRSVSSWWKIHLGKAVRFYGRAIFQRHPSASISIGDGCVFRSAEWSNSIGLNRKCYISASRSAEIRIGKSSGFSGTVIAASKSITIGDRVLCGGNCTIVDTNRHPLDAVARAKNHEAGALPIVIEDDVFLGMNVVVLKGAKIGKGTVVAANSVVASSLPAGVIAGGVPAKVIRELSDED